MNYSDVVSEDVLKSRNPGCNCTDDCSSESECACLVRSYGRNYSILEHLLLQVLNCTNRLVQYFTNDFTALQVYETATRGRGVQATRDLVPGEFVCTFKGLYLPMTSAYNEAALQFKRYGDIYVMVVREFIGYAHRLVVETAIDGTSMDWEIKNYPPPSAFINHSCCPNMTVVPVRVETDQPIFALFATKDIDLGEELTYDYIEKSGEHIIPSSKRCLCGAENCRRLLPQFI
ncbi:unnamed protein product [Mesocestoides corti]|uniref:Histone-lysine N-methyltransferase n=1 Tax=Mesocestoides corti TaxID=53468 RepID=A0A0R3UK43_MESCO|nr:unnamed protein product [Mesocestoides corti]